MLGCDVMGSGLNPQKGANGGRHAAMGWPGVGMQQGWVLLAKRY